MCNATELGRDTDVTAFEELSLDGAITGCHVTSVGLYDIVVCGQREIGGEDAHAHLTW